MLCFFWLDINEMKCSLSNAYTHTNSDQRCDNLAEQHGVHTVLPATHKWNEPSCIHFVSIHQMAPPGQGNTHLDQLSTHLSTSKG